MSYPKMYNPSRTSQTERARPEQVKGRAGGYVFKASDWALLDRFLILGSASNTYYATGNELTRENGALVEALMRGPDAPRAVDRAVQVSVEGLAHKPEPVLFALALGLTVGSHGTRARINQRLLEVLRTGTHMFTFVTFLTAMRGLGSGPKKALARFYELTDVDRLAFTMTKYQQRGGMSQRDLLRLVRPRVLSRDVERKALLDYFASPENFDPVSMTADASNRKRRRGFYGTKPTVALELSGREVRQVVPKIVRGYELAKAARSAGEVVGLIKEYGLSREMIPTQWMSDPIVMSAMMDNMPMIALTRSLSTLTRIGVLGQMGAGRTKDAVARLGDKEEIRRSRAHPLHFLAARTTYASGRSARGSSEWTPIPAVSTALDGAFKAAFKNVVPTGKRIMLALDVSGSMGGADVSGIPGLTARDASGALALVTAATEDNYMVVGFTGGGRSGYGLSAWGRPSTPDPRVNQNGPLSVLEVNGTDTLSQVIKTISGLPFGTTDCSLPMTEALRNGWEIDAFVVYTDSETYAGRMQPFQALQEYRRKTGINAKLVVVGMVANQFSIADPSDVGMLDVVGFSADTPAVIADFIRD